MLNKCALYCDNNEIVKKMKKTRTYEKQFKPSYEMSKNETVLAIQHYLPHHFSVIHIYSHQDKVKWRSNLTYSKRLNELVDKVTDKYACSPINNHVPYSPIAIYFDNIYIANNYYFYLRRLYFQQDANEYLKQNYTWSNHILAYIDWASHVKIINKQFDHSY